jgi:hypothetical protein
MFENVNWLAAVASVIAATVVGTLWYGPLFGKAWMAEIGRTPEQLKVGQVPAMASALVANFIAGAVLSTVIAAFSVTTLGGSLAIGLVVWIAFVGGQQFMQDRFHARSIKLSLINAGNTLASVLAMSAVIHFIG